MPADERGLHYGPQALSSYLMGYMSEGAAAEIDGHLGVCPRCRDLALQRSARPSLVDRWSAESHRHAVLRERLAARLAEAEQAPSAADWRERLRNWRVQWGGLAAAVVSCVVDVSGDITQAVVKGMEAFAMPALEPVEVWRELAAPAAPPPPVLLESRRRGDALDVLIHADSPREPLVLLAICDGESRVAVAKRLSGDGPPFFVASFDAVPPGTHLISVEPMEPER
jgi:hypothetical protein